MSARSFEHRFEGSETLDGLLEIAGSALDTQDVLARLVAGHQAGAAAAEVIPTLFEVEPRFPNPEIARRLYQNLLGLWDLVSSGRKIELEPTARSRPKRVRPVAPPPFDADQGPDTAFVEAAWRYLEDLPEGDPRALQRLTHAFENREDALVQWLEEAGLDDDAYATVRYLLFELFAMLEIGWPSGVGAVTRQALEAAPEQVSGDVPPALRAYADEALFESELDDARVPSLVYRGLNALWHARRRGERT
jgi:hypothetical protein